MIKILTIVGARPQFIKAATLSRAIEHHNRSSEDIQVEEIIVHTGQHYDKNMSDIFFSQMNIPHPKYNLGVGGKSHGAMTGQMLESIEQIILNESPNIVIVYGDTNSTLAGALAAAKLKVPVAHVESGLRSFNRHMPEEINRVLTDKLSTLLFCPTQEAYNNLVDEGYNLSQAKAYVVGDVMLDAAKFYESSAVKPRLNSGLRQGFVLATIHRAENTDNINNLRTIFTALNEISGDIDIVCPIHPRTKTILDSLEFKFNFEIVEPVSYFEMIWLLKNCSFVMTDSGGLQKEAFFFEKYCLTLRQQTEWNELVEIGVNKLVDIDVDKIVRAALKIKDYNKEVFKGITPYGSGNASFDILNFIIKSI
ncbi:non-hydrolyzing UDP-N-acetylglucosamine 2-epimerase [Shewanella algae]|uniref:non-hydrolyzing UDP-N-acetylglucosamine 2-epimerase n=1 Tax=Shewanella algae TaxID=38313 RepID=UPI00300432D5